MPSQESLSPLYGNNEKLRSWEEGFEETSETEPELEVSWPSKRADMELNLEEPHLDLESLGPGDKNDEEAIQEGTDRCLGEIHKETRSREECLEDTRDPRVGNQEEPTSSRDRSEEAEETRRLEENLKNSLVEESEKTQNLDLDDDDEPKNKCGPEETPKNEMSKPESNAKSQEYDQNDQKMRHMTTTPTVLSKVSLFQMKTYNLKGPSGMDTSIKNLTKNPTGHADMAAEDEDVPRPLLKVSELKKRFEH